MNVHRPCSSPIAIVGGLLLVFFLFFLPLLSFSEGLQGYIYQTELGLLYQKQQKENKGGLWFYLHYLNCFYPENVRVLLV